MVMRWLVLVHVILIVLLQLALVIVAESDYEETTDDAAVVKVFILAGQSNMVGMGSLEHLDLLIHNDTSTCCNPYRAALWNGTGYKIRDNVFIRYDTRQGNLTVGYGADKDRFGPELMLGWVLGDAASGTSTAADPSPSLASANETNRNIIYLIKTAWGGKDLAVDFRPPRSGEGNYDQVLPSQYGVYYRAMVESVQQGLEQIGSIIPNYNATTGYKISGFAWFQGWNDMVDAHKVNEYAYNLANLIRDVSIEWQVPDLPFVVGELGMHGVNYTGSGADRVYGIRHAQQSVPSLPEFRHRALFVPTAQYAVPNGKAYNGNYHYNGRADTFFHIGQAMGRGMLALSQNREDQVFHHPNREKSAYSSTAFRSRLRPLGGDVSAS